MQQLHPDASFAAATRSSRSQHSTTRPIKLSRPLSLPFLCFVLNSSLVAAISSVSTSSRPALVPALMVDGAVEALDCVEEEEESEFEGDEDEGESEISMVFADSSDDDRIRDSDDDVEDEMETIVENVNTEEARLTK
ncbi:hypothetical protein PsorP6_011891 [Peronosclerospora sorghi]|uniref:Uncharacterized protein n=1 Tax=Peronosclerospora sorghi TaxID=230839 RepID=A0ACC0WM78_9STRA|nr:hypothetical protein PsorP6_011891 [Peronosclerospora sorghi]